jgi:hypothetical protein
MADALACDSVPSDVVAALRLLQAQFPRHLPTCASLPPVLLLTQLYSLVADRTAVDKETHALVASGTLRVLRLTTGSDERGFLFAEDYAALVDTAAAACAHDTDAAAVLHAFKCAVLPACTGATAALGRVEAALADAAPCSPPDAQLRVVMTHGFMVRGEVASRAQPPVLYFTAPQMGAFQRSLLAGRAAILRFLARKPQRRALRAAVEALKLRACILPVRCALGSVLLLHAQQLRLSHLTHPRHPGCICGARHARPRQPSSFGGPLRRCAGLTMKQPRCIASRSCGCGTGSQAPGGGCPRASHRGPLRRVTPCAMLGR